MDKHYVCDKHKTKGNTGKCPLCHPDHIADATQKVQPAPAPLPESVESALGVVALSDYPSVEPVLRFHISDLARRLAEAEAENWRFAGRLESSVSDWRKLYTEERAERVRIEGILLNDVQDERQESDEHIKGLVTVIKTQDKNIGDLKAHIQRIGVDHDDVEARAEAAEARVRELERRTINWIPVTKQLPETDGYVLTHSLGGSIRTECFFSDPCWTRRAETFEQRRDTAFAYGQASVHFDHALNYGYTITHWAKYPDPPEEYSALAACEEVGE